MATVKPVAEDDHHVVWRFEGRLLKANHYLVLDKQKEKMFAIDSGFGDSQVNQVVKEMNSSLSAIYLTHGHFDHSGGAAILSDEFECQTFIKAKDLKTIRSSNFLLKVLGHETSMKLPVLELVEDGFNDELVEFLDCPGHTPGSVVIRVGEFMFTGDSIYADCLNAVKLPEQDDSTLNKSILRILDRLLGAERIFPGHGRNIRGRDLLTENVQLREELFQR